MTLRLATVIIATALTTGPAWADDVAFTLQNASASDLTEFYASPVGNANWEENILSSGALAAGASGEVKISNVQGCDYDLRMVFADGDVLEDSSNICETGTYTVQ